MVMSLKSGRLKLNQTQQFADYDYVILEVQGDRKSPIREAIKTFHSAFQSLCSDKCSNGDGSSL